MKWYDAQEDDSLIPEISSGSTPNVAQGEDAGVSENSNSSPANIPNMILEQRTFIGRLIRKPIRYREDV